MNLKSLQAAFQEALLGQNSLEVILPYLLGTESLSARTGFSVYQQGYQLRLIDSLANTYPKLYAWWGAETFERNAAAYVACHPSQHFSLYQFSRHFVEFLQKKFPEHPEYAELAAFEEALDRVLRVVDAPTLRLDALQKLSPEQWPFLRLVLHPSVRICTFFWNTMAIWEALSEEGRSVPDAVSGASPCVCVVWYHQRQAYYLVLSASEAIMLGALAEGLDFSECCEQLCAQMDASEVPGFVVSTLVRWVEMGFFTV